MDCCWLDIVGGGGDVAICCICACCCCCKRLKVWGEAGWCLRPAAKALTVSDTLTDEFGIPVGGGFVGVIGLRPSKRYAGGGGRFSVEVFNECACCCNKFVELELVGYREMLGVDRRIIENKTEI